MLTKRSMYDVLHTYVAWRRYIDDGAYDRIEDVVVPTIVLHTPIVLVHATDTLHTTKSIRTCTTTYYLSVCT